MSAASLRISSGDLLLPHDASWLDLLERELLGFPNTRHDNQADAVAQLLNWQNVPIDEIVTAVVASGPMLSFGLAQENFRSDPESRWGGWLPLPAS